MKKLFTMAILILGMMGMTIPGQDTTNSINSFMGLDFGSELKINMLGKTDIFTTFPQLAKILPKLSSSPDLNKDRTEAEFRAKKTKLGDITCFIYLIFTTLPNESPNLIKKSFVFTSVRVTFDSGNFNKFKEILIAKYGTPTTIQSTQNQYKGRKSPMSQSIRWELEGVSVVAEEFFEEGGFSAFAGALNGTGPTDWRSRVIIKSNTVNTTKTTTPLF